jgi:hypothetical protein
VTGRAVCAYVATGAVALSCVSPAADLPPVAAVRSAVPACTPDRYGREVVEVVNAADALWRCEIAARRQACSGAVRFDVEVDEFGRNAVIRWSGHAEPVLRACVEAAVRDAALGPATDCRGEFVRGSTSGAVVWNLGDSGFSHRLANLAGVIPALDSTCLAAPTDNHSPK